MHPAVAAAGFAALALAGATAAARSGEARRSAAPAVERRSEARPSAAGPAEAARGTYRLVGTARVDAGAVLSRDVEARADAIVRPAGRADALRVRLAAQGHACELEAALERREAIAFPAGQRCAFDVDDPGARGKVDARLRSGRGTVRDGKLSLELAFELSGAVSLQTARTVEVLGRTVELPAAWTPEMPLRGTAAVTAEGHRDESRAGDR